MNEQNNAVSSESPPLVMMNSEEANVLLQPLAREHHRDIQDESSVPPLTSFAPRLRFWTRFFILPVLILILFSGPRMGVGSLEKNIDIVQNMHQRDVGLFFNLFGQDNDKKSGRDIMHHSLTILIALFGVVSVVCLLFAMSIRRQVISLDFLEDTCSNKCSTTTTRNIHGQVSKIMDSFLDRGNTTNIRSGSSFLVSLTFALTGVAIMLTGTFSCKKLALQYAIDAKCFNPYEHNATAAVLLQDSNKTLQIQGDTAVVPDDIIAWAMNVTSASPRQDEAVMVMEDGCTFFASNHQGSLSLFSLQNGANLQYYPGVLKPQSFVTFDKTLHTVENKTGNRPSLSNFCFFSKNAENATDKRYGWRFKSFAVLCYQTGHQGALRTILPNVTGYSVTMSARHHLLWVRYEIQSNSTDPTRWRKVVVFSLNVTSEEKSEEFIFLKEETLRDNDGSGKNDFESTCWDQLEWINKWAICLVASLASAWLFFGPCVPSWSAPLAIVPLAFDIGMYAAFAVPIIFAFAVLFTPLSKPQREVAIWTLYTFLLLPLFFGLNVMSVGDMLPQNTLAVLVRMSVTLAVSFILDQLQGVSAALTAFQTTSAVVLSIRSIIIQEPFVLPLVFLEFMLGISFLGMGSFLNKSRPYVIVYGRRTWRGIRGFSRGQASADQDEENSKRKL